MARIERDSTPQQAQLLRYWLSLKEDGLPDYRRFDPIDIPNLLGDLIVIDVERPAMRFKYRLYGTRVAHVRGGDLTGRYADEAGANAPDLQAVYVESYQAAATTGEPTFSIVPWTMQRRSTGHYHRLVLPFTDSAIGSGACEVVVVCFQSVPFTTPGPPRRR